MSMHRCEAGAVREGNPRPFFRPSATQAQLGLANEATDSGSAPDTRLSLLQVIYSGLNVQKCRDGLIKS